MVDFSDEDDAPLTDEEIKANISALLDRVLVIEERLKIDIVPITTNDGRIYKMENRLDKIEAMVYPKGIPKRKQLGKNGRARFGPEMEGKWILYYPIPDPEKGQPEKEAPLVSEANGGDDPKNQE